MKLRCILQQNNVNLMREVECLLEILTSAFNSLPPEMYDYYGWVIKRLNIVKCQVEENFQYLELGQDVILPDILNKTEDLNRYFYLFNRRFLSSILRAKQEDRLCLNLLRWLHLSHTKTQVIPVAVIDGDFASLPSISSPTIYMIPPSIQHGLLYLPILFHEFGHLLYACHKQEMNDLVRDLQQQIAHFLEPGSLFLRVNVSLADNWSLD